MKATVMYAAGDVARGSGRRESAAIDGRARDDRGRTRAGPCVHRGADADVLEGRIQPGRVFDREIDVDAVTDGYRQMNDCKAIKVMIDFA
jgi:hypothetical protein